MEIILAPNTLEEAQRFKGKLPICKMGLPLMVDSSHVVIGLLERMGYQILYDGKFHDIPSVVGRAVEGLATQSIWGLTVHADGGKEMLRAAKGAAGNIKVFAVLRLTSLGLDWSGWVEIRRNLKICSDVVDGVVCPVAAVAIVKKETPHLMTLCPGVRFPRGDREDQNVVSTFRAAAKSGANAIIVGRPLTEAADPDEALARIRIALNGQGNEGT